MPLIKSISGIRGTIGGLPGEGLTPMDIVRFASAYAQWLKARVSKNQYKVVIGRDARISGDMVERIVSGTIAGLGIDMISLGPASTPTVEIAVVKEKADGGIIITASHNPGNWNALKLLNDKGEFLSATDGEQIIQLAENGRFNYSEADRTGTFTGNSQYNDIHIDDILELDLVNHALIKKAGFRIAVDCINSVGGIIVPKLLKKLGVREIFELNCIPDGIFRHNPEPLPENLQDLSRLVKEKNADLGFAVDPDVDRLAIVCEDGSMFGEEYTLVAVADYILEKKPGNTASNLSSSRALRDITISKGQRYFASAVGEVNVIEAMKANSCVIGGEGNGGVIYPEFHYGRDALVGIALFLTSLAEKRLKCSELRKTFPQYIISKNKVVLSGNTDFESIKNKVKLEFKLEIMDERDGIKIDFKEGWVHLRKSNTEPVIRVYAEAKDLLIADQLAKKIINIIKG